MAVGQYYIKNDVLFYDDGSGFKKKGKVGGLVSGAPMNSALMAYMGPGREKVDPVTRKPVKKQPQNTEDLKQAITNQEPEKDYKGLKLSAPATPSAGNSLRYPLDTPIEKGTDYVIFEFYEYNPPFKSDGTTADPNTSSLDAYNYSAEVTNYKKATDAKPIILYMPEDISTGHKASWTGKNFSNIGRGIMQTAGATNFGAGLKEFGDTINTQLETFVPIAGAQLISGAIGKITGESISIDEFIGSTRGVILNPNSELLFSGIDMRNFNLNYKLVPRNEREASQIDQIIRTFKKEMLPSANSGAEDLKQAIQVNKFQSSFIKVPDVCRVSFMRGNALNPDVPQYKMCALTQVDISYTPDGVYATTADGRMVAYQLALSFQETKLIFKEDIKMSGASY